jgi:hypothetical protein
MREELSASSSRELSRIPDTAGRTTLDEQAMTADSSVIDVGTNLDIFGQGVTTLSETQTSQMQTSEKHSCAQGISLLVLEPLKIPGEDPQKSTNSEQPTADPNRSQSLRSRHKVAGAIGGPAAPAARPTKTAELSVKCPASVKAATAVESDELVMQPPALQPVTTEEPIIPSPFVTTFTPLSIRRPAISEIPINPVTTQYSVYDADPPTPDCEQSCAVENGTAVPKCEARAEVPAMGVMPYGQENFLADGLSLPRVPVTPTNPTNAVTEHKFVIECGLPATTPKEVTEQPDMPDIAPIPTTCLSFVPKEPFHPKGNVTSPVATTEKDPIHIEITRNDKAVSMDDEAGRDMIDFSEGNNTLDKFIIAKEQDRMSFRQDLTPEIDGRIVPDNLNVPLNIEVDWEEATAKTERTSNLQARQVPVNSDQITRRENSDADLLRNFVKRVNADRDAKVKENLQPGKRRSGSTGHTGSGTGSPNAHSMISAANRRPLGEKSVNSPSPTKTHKCRDSDADGLVKDKNDQGDWSNEGEISAPKLKRRRKGMVAELETTLDGPRSQLDVTSAEAPTRRSTRARSTRVPLKSAALSANAVAMSQVPVRLPGSALIPEKSASLGKSLLAARNIRNVEREWATTTRMNTRRNKGNALRPSEVVALQREDHNDGKIRELKSLFDAREGEEGAEDESIAEAGKTIGRRPPLARAAKMKNVRWDPVLVRIQGDGGGESLGLRAREEELKVETEDNEASPLNIEEPRAPRPAPKGSKKRARNESEEEEPQRPAKKAAATLLRKRATQVVVASEKKPATTTKKRATRASKLQLPTLIKPSPQLPPKTVPRRGKITSLGSTNGTPAPKRRTRVIA